MTKRLQTLGVVLALIGLGFLVGAGVAYSKVQAGYDSLKALSAAQNVELTYNDNGQLADDTGSTKEAEAIMSLLKDDWKYPVVKSDLNPNDPVVNTASEFMYQMATVSYHTLHGTQTVVLPEDAEYNGQGLQGRQLRLRRRTAGTGPASTARTRSRALPASRPGRAPHTV